MDAPIPNAVKVRNFINKGSSLPPVTLGDFAEFWKSVSSEDRARFGAEVDTAIN